LLLLAGSGCFAGTLLLLLLLLLSVLLLLLALTPVAALQRSCCVRQDMKCLLLRSRAMLCTAPPNYSCSKTGAPDSRSKHQLDATARQTADVRGYDF
jgi:hypothetical protein